MSDSKDIQEEENEAEAPEEIEEEEAAGPTDEEWKRRVLCSDEACIGVIGPDGRCKECGKPYEGALPGAAATDGSPPSSETPSAQTSEEDNADAAETDSSPSPEEPADEADEWKNRRLCSDGNCIGVIGPDGRCKECGKPYEGD